MQLHQLVSRIHKVSASPVNFMELTFVFLNLPEDEKENCVKQPLSTIRPPSDNKMSSKMPQEKD